MLTPSPRHRPADLALWRELEQGDLLESRRPALAGRVAASLAAVRDFAAKGPCYASVSWGKDSVVLAWLVATAAPRVPLVNLRVSPTRNPDCDAVRDAFLARHPLDYHEEPVDYGGVDPSLPTVVWDRETYRLWDAAWRRVSARFGGRHLSGVRGDESRGRSIRVKRWGLASPNACAPLGHWTQAQVFAALAAAALPVHPAYAMLGGGRWPRDRLRTSEVGDEKGVGCGRRAWESEYYGDVLRRLAARRTPAAQSDALPNRDPHDALPVSRRGHESY